jgi:hypothetical protein
MSANTYGREKRRIIRPRDTPAHMMPWRATISDGIAEDRADEARLPCHDHAILSLPMEGRKE